MYLILYNRRTSMASVISIPPDLFVYIPGYTMQRINNAYPVGGIYPRQGYAGIQPGYRHRIIT